MRNNYQIPILFVSVFALISLSAGALERELLQRETIHRAGIEFQYDLLRDGEKISVGVSTPSLPTMPGERPRRVQKKVILPKGFAAREMLRMDDQLFVIAEAEKGGRYLFVVEASVGERVKVWLSNVQFAAPLVAGTWALGRLGDLIAAGDHTQVFLTTAGAGVALLSSVSFGVVMLGKLGPKLKTTSYGSLPWRVTEMARDRDGRPVEAWVKNERGESMALSRLLHTKCEDDMDH